MKEWGPHHGALVLVEVLFCCFVVVAKGSIDTKSISRAESKYMPMNLGQDHVLRVIIYMEKNETIYIVARGLHIPHYQATVINRNNTGRINDINCCTTGL